MRLENQVNCVYHSSTGMDYEVRLFRLKPEVPPENYLALKRLGGAADSFNDVVTDVLRERKALQTGCSCQIPQSVETNANRGGLNPNG